MGKRSRALVVAALAATLGAGGGEAWAWHEYVYTPTTPRFFMRIDGPCPGTLYLSTSAGSGEPGCGYPAGAPVGELHHAGIFGSTVRVYASRDGTPQYLDPTRDATGNITVVATADSQRRAVGQLKVGVTVRALTESGQQVVLGSHESETLVLPTSTDEVNFPFTIAMNDALDKIRLDKVAVDVDIHGWHLLTGYHRLNGKSYLDLPAYVRATKPH